MCIKTTSFAAGKCPAPGSQIVAGRKHVSHIKINKQQNYKYYYIVAYLSVHTVGKVLEDLTQAGTAPASDNKTSLTVHFACYHAPGYTKYSNVPLPHCVNMCGAGTTIGGCAIIEHECEVFLMLHRRHLKKRFK